jgi:hypothetical protein
VRNLSALVSMNFCSRFKVEGAPGTAIEDKACFLLGELFGEVILIKYLFIFKHFLY